MRHTKKKQNTSSQPSEAIVQNQNANYLETNKHDIARWELCRQNKRIKESRDNLKIKNQEKAKQIKALSGKIDDLQVSRDAWKTKYEEHENRIKTLIKSINEVEQRLKKDEALLKESERLLNLERKLRLNEIEIRDSQINELKKNSRARTNTPSK